MVSLKVTASSKLSALLMNAATCFAAKEEGSNAILDCEVHIHGTS